MKKCGEIKVVVIGSSDVGKTTLMENLIGRIGKVEHNGITTAIDYGSLTINDKKIHFFGTPGQKRFEFMRELALKGTNLALVVLDASRGITKEDEEIIKLLESKQIPYGVFINKTDIGEININDVYNLCNPKFVVKGSAIKKEGINELFNEILYHTFSENI
ncbi:GTP-binding protein [Methanocaldococcus sp. 28A]